MLIPLQAIGIVILVKQAIGHFNGKLVSILTLAKKSQEVIFSRKIQKTFHPFIYFINKSVEQVPSQKQLALILDKILNFQEYLKNILNKVNKTIGLLRKLQNILPREPLLTIYKSFVGPSLVNGYCCL